MKKCYILGKISGLPEEEYKANFAKAKNEVLKLGMLPISPVDLLHDHDKKWESYMKCGIKAMMDCQAVFCLKEFRTSPGASIEHDLAFSLKYEMHYQSYPIDERNVEKDFVLKLNQYPGLPKNLIQQAIDRGYKKGVKIKYVPHAIDTVIGDYFEVADNGDLEAYAKPAEERKRYDDFTRDTLYNASKNEWVEIVT